MGFQVNKLGPEPLPTTKLNITDTWTDLGTGPMTVGVNRGRTWFWQGDTAPACGYLLAAQGQQRLVSFAKADRVWARAVDGDLDAIKITGAVAQGAAQSGLVFELYSQLPDPTTVKSGTFGVVTNDPVEGLSGVHVALGSAPDAMATYWRSAA
jgi:hypothetical protein